METRLEKEYFKSRLLDIANEVEELKEDMKNRTEFALDNRNMKRVDIFGRRFHQLIRLEGEVRRILEKECGVENPMPKVDRFGRIIED